MQDEKLQIMFSSLLTTKVIQSVYGPHSEKARFDFEQKHIFLFLIAFRPVLAHFQGVGRISWL